MTALNVVAFFGGIIIGVSFAHTFSTFGSKDDGYDDN